MSTENDKKLDDMIARALKIDVPELDMPELPEIETGKVTAIRPKRRLSPPAWLAMAATVAVAAIISVRMLGSSVEYDSLAEQVLAHIDHEPAALVVTDRVVGDDRLHAVVPADLAELDHSAGLITYAQSCVINGRTVPHLVIQGKHGPVTILLMPGEHVDEAIDVMGDHVNGVILPVGDGSIAIVGELEEPLDGIRKKVLSSVTWGT